MPIEHPEHFGFPQPKLVLMTGEVLAVTDGPQDDLRALYWPLEPQGYYGVDFHSHAYSRDYPYSDRGWASRLIFVHIEEVAPALCVIEMDRASVAEYLSGSLVIPTLVEGEK